MIIDSTIARGMFFLGFLASSPVVATQSKPTNLEIRNSMKGLKLRKYSTTQITYPKKHLAAPIMTPLNPKGRKPPSPAFSWYSSSMPSLGINQLDGLAENILFYEVFEGRREDILVFSAYSLWLQRR